MTDDLPNLRALFEELKTRIKNNRATREGRREADDMFDAIGDLRQAAKRLENPLQISVPLDEVLLACRACWVTGKPAAPPGKSHIDVVNAKMLALGDAITRCHPDGPWLP